MILSLGRKHFSLFLAAISLPTSFVLASTGPCPPTFSFNGYSDLGMLEADIKNELSAFGEHIIKGGSPSSFEGETFPLCPNSFFEFSGSSDYLSIDYPNIHIKCGPDGSSVDNCVFSGGSNQIIIQGPHAINFKASGITFANSTSDGVNILAVGNPKSDATFEDCIFKQNNGYLTVLNYRPLSESDAPTFGPTNLPTGTSSSKPSGAPSNIGTSNPSLRPTDTSAPSSATIATSSPISSVIANETITNVNETIADANETIADESINSTRRLQNVTTSPIAAINTTASPTSSPIAPVINDKDRAICAAKTGESCEACVTTRLNGDNFCLYFSSLADPVCAAEGGEGMGDGHDMCALMTSSPTISDNATISPSSSPINSTIANATSTPTASPIDTGTNSTNVPTATATNGTVQSLLPTIAPIVTVNTTMSPTVSTTNATIANDTSAPTTTPFDANTTYVPTSNATLVPSASPNTTESGAPTLQLISNVTSAPAPSAPSNSTYAPTTSAISNVTSAPTPSTPSNASFVPTSSAPNNATSAPTSSTIRNVTSAPTSNVIINATSAPTVPSTTNTTSSPTVPPTSNATSVPTASPTTNSTITPSSPPTINATSAPTTSPTLNVSLVPSVSPTSTSTPSMAPSNSSMPSDNPSTHPSFSPSAVPTFPNTISSNLDLIDIEDGLPAMSVTFRGCVFMENDNELSTIAAIGGHVEIIDSEFTNNKGLSMTGFIMGSEGSVTGTCFSNNLYSLQAPIFVETNSTVDITNNFGQNNRGVVFATSPVDCNGAFLQEGKACIFDSPENCTGVCQEFDAEYCPLYPSPTQTPTVPFVSNDGADNRDASSASSIISLCKFAGYVTYIVIGVVYWL
mmetsp:Transcript_13711/g.15743  ORF Transcript_13711/g.15743 Transcript_13711/m.15743 type:complete len:861 (+) Transcript_13711:142-2724(+)